MSWHYRHLNHCQIKHQKAVNKSRAVLSCNKMYDWLRARVHLNCDGHDWEAGHQNIVVLLIVQGHLAMFSDKIDMQIQCKLNKCYVNFNEEDVNIFRWWFLLSLLLMLTGMKKHIYAFAFYILHPYGSSTLGHRFNTPIHLQYLI